MDRARKAWLWLAILAASTAPAAHAHLMNSGFGPFYDGVAHPLTSAEDLLPIAAVALLAGLSGARYGRWLLAALPAAWTIGMIAGWALGVPAIPLWAAAAATALAGAAVAADLRLPLAVVLGLAAAIGALHGFANGTELTAAPRGLVAIAGTACCLAVVVSLLAGQVTSLRAQWARLAVRVCGSWIAAIGLLMLGWSARM
ncbi:MAG: HupE/UreJ family protein [Xanthobacteraceae bacterium]